LRDTLWLWHAIQGKGHAAFLWEAQKMHKSPVARTLAWVYAALAAFTGLSIIIPLILDRRSRSRREGR